MTEILEGTAFYCVECGYDLRHLDSNRCPECGALIDRTAIGQSIIPWRQRARIGRFRGFWATVWMITFRPQRIAAEMNRPADLDDALKFRRIVVILAMLLLTPATTLILNEIFGRYWYTPLFLRSDPFGAALNILLMLCVWVGGLFFLWTATGVACYFSHPRSLPIEQQNRAIALSYYGCAPLAYAPAIAALSIVLFLAVMRRHTPVYVQIAIMLFAFAPPALLVWQIWRAPVRVLRAATRCGGERQAVFGLLLPIIWAALAGLFVVVIPAAICLVAMMVISL